MKTDSGSLPAGDSLHISGLWVSSHMGVTEEERATPQPLRLSLWLGVADQGIAAAGRTDDLQLTVNYSSVAQILRDLAVARPRALLETLAEEIATAVLAFPRVSWTVVEIDKFVLRDAAFARLRLERKKS